MSSTLRRGLPRVPGGQPWPPEGTAVPPTDFTLPAVGQAPTAPTPPAQVEAQAPAPAPAPASASAPGSFRRGLPRVEGGEPWPPADAAPAAGPSEVVGAHETEPATPATDRAGEDVAPPANGQARRGLPRTPGAEPWPPAGTTVTNAFAAVPSQAPSDPAPVDSAPAEPTPLDPAVVDPDPVAVTPPPAEPQPAPAPAQTPPAPTPPAPTPPAQTPPAPAKPAAAARAAASPMPPARRYGPFTAKQWLGAGAVIALAIVGAVTLVVLAARWFTGLEFMQSFLAKYPGEYGLPESAPVGFPGWLGWQHFFNIFLMVLIIRSGILVRRQERPEAFWSSKKNPKKISIQLWLHQGLNILWVINGAIFIILLFATGQWMRVIPTSPEVFPNAVSALLQYLTLDWPLDNGWVNYNSLQQLAYFATIFIAAPLSALSGYRMSESWPRESRLSQKFPVEWARTLHFPLMIYFVAFIVVHVALVFSTGALRNLNHMFAAQGSPDPSVYANNWTGFWMFILSMVIVAGSWIAARPMVIAPIARIFGTVSAR